MTNTADTAAAQFDRGFNCAQSVLNAFAEQIGLDASQALKLASIFGAGMARRGEVCGAVTGALMALGLAQGSDTPEGKQASYQLGQDFLRQFEKKHGRILCRELINCDISTVEGLEHARSQGVFTSDCPLFIRTAVEITQTLLVKSP
jgi:C_GCAxxG_C_C family probable redox protein